MNDTLLQKAHQLHQQGRHQEAKALYQKLLKENPKHIEVLHALAILYVKCNEYNDALATLDKALHIDKTTAYLYNSKGNILLALGKWDQAVQQYQKAIRCDHQYALAYNNLGKAYYSQNKLEQARQYYEQAIELMEHYSDAHYNLGILLARVGDFDKAIFHLQKTLALNSNQPAAYGQLAEIYLNIGDYKKAIEYYQKRLDHQPQHTASLFALGQTYLKNKQIDKAITTLKNTLILEPQHPQAHHSLANAELLSGDSNIALNHYFRQLEIHPMMESYYNIGILLMDQNRHKESLQYLKQAAEIEPNYLPTHINLGALYLKLHHIAEAIKHYEIALTIKPDDPEIQYILAALKKNNTPDQAPIEYLSHLFDQYATYYDQHLMEHLQYQVHELLFKAINIETTLTPHSLTVLDLGCGTGLCGQSFKPLTKKLIGIDVSEKMLAAAKAKNIYDQLKKVNATTALDQFQHNDLIIAGDVFSYIGALDIIHQKAYDALNPEGLFAYTVEKTYTEPYELQETIRYAHSKTYLDKLIKNSSFKTICFNNIILRKQHNLPVEGYLVILKK